jgi:hypothetical protein
MPPALNKLHKNASLRSLAMAHLQTIHMSKADTTIHAA